MAFTDNCDLYGAFHEDGVNRIIKHIVRQRPSLFNYATAEVAANREQWCSKVEFTSDVTKYGNPLFTVMNPLPVLGADSPPVGLGFCAQLSDARIDLHPGKLIELPAELHPPLAKQHFALQFKVCGGIACPSSDEIGKIPVSTGDRDPKASDQPGKIVVLDGRLECFCLDVFVIGHFEHALVGGHEVLLGKVDDIDIVDIKPDGLEDSIACYLKTTVAVLLREKLTIAIETFMFSFPLFGLATVTLAPTPNPPIPNNPAIEDDQLKAFITMHVI
jgi:hypothetical protein